MIYIFTAIFCKNKAIATYMYKTTFYFQNGIYNFVLSNTESSVYIVLQ